MDRDHLILIDSREKTPLPFPPNLTAHNPSQHTPTSQLLRLHTKVATLETGDYILASAPTAGCVERKAHLTELATNLFSPEPRRRFRNELLRLREHFSAPLLVLEGSPTKLASHRGQPGEPPPALILDCLISTCLEFSVPVLFLDSSTPDARRQVAEIVARHLIHSARHWRSRPCPVSTLNTSQSDSTPLAKAPSLA